MKYSIIILAVSYFSLVACNRQKTIVVDVTLLDSFFTEQETYVYLYDCVSRKNIDSQLVKENKVKFIIQPDANFYPHLVALKTWDSYKNINYQRQIGFANPFKEKNFTSRFYLDYGITKIKTHTYPFGNKNSTISGSPQNEPYFKDIYLSYPDTNANHRKPIITINCKKIKKYAYSLFLLGQLYFYKEYFTVDELKEQLNYFDTAIKRLTPYTDFEKYFPIANSYGKAYPADIKLKNNKGDYDSIGTKNAKATLVVFWASWCGPCRKEIPFLKELYANYQKMGLEICSISIDTNEDYWQSAIHQEKLSWQQFIAIDSTRIYMDKQYNIAAIPKTYLYDENKNLVNKFLGLEDAEKMKKAVEKLLKE